MASNGITSSKVPPRWGGNTKGRRIRMEGVSMLQEDLGNQEMQVGQRGRLSTVQANPMSGLTQRSRDELLAKAGLSVSNRTTRRG